MSGRGRRFSLSVMMALVLAFAGARTAAAETPAAPVAVPPAKAAEAPPAAKAAVPAAKPAEAAKAAPAPAKAAETVPAKADAAPAKAEAKPASALEAPLATAVPPSMFDERSDLKGDLTGGFESAEGLEQESIGFALVRMVVVLGIVVGAIYLTLNFGLRRLMGLKGPLGRRSVVQVVERIPLDAKKSMYLLKAAGEYLLIGGGDGALNLICKLDPAEVSRLEQEKAAAAAVATPALSPFLQKLLSRRGGP